MANNTNQKQDIKDPGELDRLSECNSLANTEPFSMVESMNVDTIDNMLENKKSMATIDSIYIDAFDIDKHNGIMLKQAYSKNLVESTEILNKESKMRADYELSENFDTFGCRTEQGISQDFTMRTVESKIIESINIPTFKDGQSNLESNRTVDSIYVDTPSQMSYGDINQFMKKGN